MNINGVVYTTNKKAWVKKNLTGIYPVIKRVPGTTVSDFEIIEVSLPPIVPRKEEGGGVRIEWDWLKSKYPTTGSVLCLHISRDEHDRIGLRHPNGGRLGGSYNRNIGDESMEFVVVADTKQSFHRIFLHELAHGISHWTGVADKTHHYDYDLGNIEGIYKTFTFSKWNILNTTVSLLKTQLSLLLNKEKAVARFRKPYPPTQDYGELNPIYTATGRHIGIDYACPVGTEIIAPLDGEVAEAGFHPELGNYCYFIYTFKGATYVDRLMHLSEIPSKKKVTRGTVMALSGNTGKSTGPHLHVDTWREAVTIHRISAENWDELTVNPEHIYA